MNQTDVQQNERRKAGFYTVGELAGAIGVHRNSVIYWIKTGRLDADRAGLAERSPYRIAASDAERIIADINAE